MPSTKFELTCSEAHCALILTILVIIIIMF
jgi:hypothetical protein